MPSTRRAAASRWAPWASEPDRLLGDAYAARGNTPLALEHYRKALAKDASSWVLWQAVSLEATGAERAVAREALRRLNPILATDPPAANPGHPVGRVSGHDRHASPRTTGSAT